MKEPKIVGMTDEKLYDLLEKLKIIAENDPENIFQNIKRIQKSLEKKEKADETTSATVEE